MFKKILGLLSFASILSMSSCAAAGGMYDVNYNSKVDMDMNAEEYNEINERGFVDPTINPLSSFSLDS